MTKTKHKTESAQPGPFIEDKLLIATLRAISQAIERACDYNVKGVRACLAELNANLAELEKTLL